MIEQTSVFDLMHPEFQIDKPIRLIELFGGIGAQSRALEIIGKPFQSHRVVEWAAPSIIAYNAIHVRDFSDRTEGLAFDEVLDRLNGVSLDYNKPATREQLRKRGEPWCRKVLSSMIAIKDYCPDVSKVRAEDLGIVDQDKYCHVLVYSFPCQDLSNAGKMAGMEKGSGTRSGLLWQVERILNECKEKDCLPQVLLMENVPGVMGSQNMKPWGEWLNALRDLGYSNKFKILNAKGFGIPQNRERAFMVSVLGDWSIPFPREFSLRHPLKDFLDDNVSESYFLSEKIIKGYIDGNQKQADKGNGFCFSLKDLEDDSEVAFTISTKEGQRRTDNYISSARGFATIDTYNKKVKINPETAQTIQPRHQVPHHGKRVIVAGSLNTDRVARKREGGIALDKVGQMPTSESPCVVSKLHIPCATKKGYMEAEEGDGVIPSWKGARGVVQKKSIPTLLTDDSTVGVVVSKTVCLNPKVDGKQPSLNDRVYSTEGCSTAVTTTPFFQGNVADRLWVRKLTEYECGKLMGFDRSDFKRISEAGLSKSALYHCAGDSIVVNVLIAIFGALLGIDYKAICEKRADCLADQKK